MTILTIKRIRRMDFGVCGFFFERRGEDFLLFNLNL